MRRTIARRTAVAACAVSFALLVGACGADKPDGDAPAGDKGKSQGKDGGSAAKALSAGELEKLVLAAGDLKGQYKVTKATKVDLVSGERVRSDKAECKPLVDVLALRPVGAAGATAKRKISQVPPKPAKDATFEESMKASMESLKFTGDTIGSYEGKGAAEAFAMLRSAGEACAGGFMLADGTDFKNEDNTKYTKVAPGTSYTGGDEALTLDLSFDLEGETGTHQVVAVRKGNTLAAFSVIALTGGKAEFPKAIVDAQVAKLG